MGVPVYRRATDWTLQGDGTKQRPDGLKAPKGFGPLLPTFFPDFYVIHAAEHRVPPAVTMHPPTTAFDLTGHEFHPKDAVVGYHRRRVTWAGHKLHPKTSGRRRVRCISYADRFFRGEGFYPLWDPLHRHPNELDP